MDAVSSSHRSLGLDLVRATAIMLVLVSHCGDFFASWLDLQPTTFGSLAGFFGVELFFVLSGFLIGGLLINIADTRPSYPTWVIFMARRWLRTLPLYFVWLAVIFLIWPPHFWDSDRSSVWRDALYYGSLTQNLAWPMVDGWFGVSWSLTVEEWFYLVFSALFLGCAITLGRRRGLLVALAVFLIVPPILRYFAFGGDDVSETIRKTAVLRLDAIAFGVAMTWLNGTWRLDRRMPYPLLAVGLFLIIFLWLDGLATLSILGGEFRQRVLLFDLTSLGFALCLPASLRLVKAAPPIAVCLQAISAQSYCIYLIHLTVLEMTDFYRTPWHVPVAVCIVADLIVIWGISYVSYHWFEKPILAMRPRQVRGTTAGELPGLAFSKVR
jgi:peptidoglycan/LPS O-acetylase OafA/YrhL